jgi:hypothetical protein
VCDTVIQTIITWITQSVVVLYFLSRRVCIIITILIRIVPFFWCRFPGVSPTKLIRVCIKVLTDAAGQTLIKPEALQKSMETMRQIYKQCDIVVEFTGVEYIVKPEYLTGTDCSVGSIGSLWQVWFTQHECSCCNQVTVFFVDDIDGATGCAFAGDSWCRVDIGINDDSTIMAHEVGHLLLLDHSSDPNNLVYEKGSDTSYNLTSYQCCVLKLSPFLINWV